MAHLLVAAVHNGELTTSPAQHVIDQLTEHKFEVAVGEFVDQPPISVAAADSTLLAWGRMQWEIEHEWRQYLLGRNDQSRPLLSRINEAWWRLRITISPGFALKAWRARQIESHVSAKHQHAWSAFLEDEEAQLLLVIESDAVWLQTSRHGLQEIVNLLEQTHMPGYVNVAGGLALDSLGIQEFDDFGSPSSGLRSMNRPVTNTSCAYMINRPMASALLGHLHTHPEHAQLGIDWLFNAYFLDAWNSEQGIVCWHADPPVLGHGSLTGVTESWHPSR